METAEEKPGEEKTGEEKTAEKKITLKQRIKNFFSYDANPKSFHDLYHRPKVRTIYDLLNREYQYPRWFSLWHMVQSFKFLTEDTYWNSLICILTATGIVLVAVELDHYSIYLELADLLYNIAYFVNMISFAYFCVHISDVGTSSILGFMVDLGSYLHYVTRLIPGHMEKFKLLCYYVRLHRPFRFLQALDDYNLQSSVSGTALKYMYIFVIVRITWGLLWLPLLPPGLYDAKVRGTTPSNTSKYFDNNLKNWTDNIGNFTGGNNTSKATNKSKKFDQLAGDFAAYGLTNDHFHLTTDNLNFTNKWTSKMPEWNTVASLNWSGSGFNWTYGVGRTPKWSAQSSTSTMTRPVRTFTVRHRRHMIYKLVQASKQNDPFHAAKKFFAAVYIINKMFIPVGPPVPINQDLERLVSIAVMMSGCLIVSGAATASLSLTISMYLRPEENFRVRYRLIVQEMIETKVPEDLRDKVDTFYKMYWHKQKGVSQTKLLQSFPPCLHAYVIMDIYFEAMQKSRILQDLSSQFLSEVAKCMQTILFIPGDPIIKRSAKKSSIIYITYGDVEMLTAEDDCTPVLRMTRGSMLSSYGACASVACARAHVLIRAATFCVAHVLNAPDLWYMAWRRGRLTGQGDIIHQAFSEHFMKVKLFHEYDRTVPFEAKHKSSILMFKQNLMALKKACDASGQQILGQTDVFLEIAGSYIMRNREDISLSDDADAICLRPTFPFILQPSSSLLAAWTWFIAIVIMVVSITIPFQLVFNQRISDDYRFYNYVITGLFLIDIYVHLSTGANVEEGVPITFTQTSSQQMRSFWFLLDVLATVPIFEFIGDGHFAGLNKLLRIVKAFRTFTGMEEVLAYESKFLRMISYLIALIMVTFFVAVLQQGFMCYQFDYCVVANVTTPPYWSKLSLGNATEHDMDDTLIFSIYWAANVITFTTHIDTLGMLNWANAVYTVFILEVCIVLHMFIEALYSATIMVTSGLTEQYESMIDDVKNVFMKSGVEPQLQERFITYLQLCWYTDMAYSMTHQMKTIFFDLPQHVYQNIMARQRSKYILCIPFMKYFNDEDLKNISANCTMFYTSPNEILLCTGDISSEMYVLKQGICEILNPDTHEFKKYLKARDHFGVLDSLLRFPAFYTVRAITHVQVISLPRKYLLDAIETTPQLRQTIEFIKHQPEYRNLLARRQRFISYEPLPPTPNCETFPLPRRHEADHEYLQPFKQLGAMSILRYISPRYTIRPDGRYLIRYEIMHAVLTLVTAMIVPGYCYLVLDFPQLYYVLWLLDFAAYFDIVQRMIVGYFNSHGVLVYHPASTAAHYLKGAFLVDLLAALPLENMVQPKRERFRLMFHVTLTKQCWMFNRLVQLYRLPSAMIVLEKYIERKDIMLIFKVLPIFLTMMNVLTCIMVFRSTRIFYGDNTHSISTNEPQGAPWFKTLEKMFRFNATSTPSRMHLACYFWVVYVSTTTGYNTIQPYEPRQMLTLVTGMILGTLIMTYVSVRIISIRANVNTLLAEYQENMKDLVAYMQAERLDKDLKREIMNYYTHNWEKLGGVDYRHVLKLCHQINLRTDAVLHLYGSTFAKCHLLADGDVALKRILGRSVRSVYFLKNTRLYEKSDILRNIYIVERGSVKMRIDNNDTTVLIRGSIYGNLLGPSSIQCPVQIVADTDIHLLQINARAFFNIISDFPSIRRKLNRLRPRNECYIEGIEHGQASTTRVKEKVMRQVFTFLHYNYAIIQVYFIMVSLAGILADMYNVGFQINTFLMIIILYILDVAFYGKVLILLAIPTVAGTDDHLRKLLEGNRSSYSELCYDLLSCIPIEAFCYLWPKSGKHRLMWFSFLRLNRMFRIYTVYKRLMQYHEQLYINLTLTTVASTLIWFTLFIHANTCLWYFIGMWQDSIKPKSSWIYDDEGKSRCNNAYVCSLYFVFTTFSQNGVGDIMPKQIPEVVFVCILMVTSTMLSMVYVGEFSNIIQYKSFRSFAFYCKYLELQEFLKNNRVSDNLVKIVNRYALHLWREARGEQLPYFLKKAPYCLKLKIMSAAYMKHLVVNEMFMGCEPAFLRQLVGYLRLHSYNEDMDVVKQGEITDCMYIIHKGQVAECSDDDTDTGRIFNTSDQFGMLQGLQYDYPFPYSYRTIWKSQILSLRLRDWEQLMMHFPRSRDAIYGNLGRHYPSVWPHPDDPSLDKELRYKDIGKRKSIFPSSRRGEETQTGQDEHNQDYRKFQFDQNLFENLESSSTSFRRKSTLSAEELKEGDQDGLREGPSTSQPDKTKESRPVKSIMKHEGSTAPSNQTTQSEALVEKYEKHIATVEFDEYLRKPKVPDKQEKIESKSIEANKQEESEEKLIAIIDMDKEREIGIVQSDVYINTAEKEDSDLKNHTVEQVESDIKHHMVPYEGKKDETINLDPVKKASLLRHYDEMDRQDRRGEQFLTSIDMNQDSDAQTPDDKALKNRIKEIRDDEYHEETDDTDEDENKEDNNEEEITTINMDQERDVILIKHPKIPRMDEHTEKSVLREKSNEELVSTIDIDPGRNVKYSRRSTVIPIMKGRHNKTHKEETSDEKLVTTIGIDQKKENEMQRRAKSGTIIKEHSEEFELGEKSDEKHVKLNLDNADKKEQEFITINMDSDIELQRLRQARLESSVGKDHQELDRQDKRGEELVTVIDVGHDTDETTKKWEKERILLNRSSRDDNLKAAYNDIDDISNIELGVDREDKRGEEVVTTIDLQDDEHQRRLTYKPNEDQEVNKNDTEDIKDQNPVIEIKVNQNIDPKALKRLMFIPDAYKQQEMADKDEQNVEKSTTINNEETAIIQLRRPTITVDDDSAELLVEHNNGKKKDTSIEIDEDDKDIIPLKRDERHHHNMSPEYKEQLEQSEENLVTIEESAVDPGQLQSYPTEERYKKEKEVIAIDIDDSKLAPVATKKREVSKTIHSEDEDEEIMTTIDIDCRKYSPQYETDKEVIDEDESTCSERRVTDSEQEKPKSAKGERCETNRKSRHSSPSVSFKQDKYMKRPHDI